MDERRVTSLSLRATRLGEGRSRSGERSNLKPRNTQQAIRETSLPKGEQMDQNSSSDLLHLSRLRRVNFCILSSVFIMVIGYFCIFIRLRQNTLQLVAGINGETNHGEAHQSSYGGLLRCRPSPSMRGLPGYGTLRRDERRNESEDGLATP